ncbi:hypothetical protein ABZ820_23865 [Streptomyces diacarni]|uniref:hypothetical protein n=1 Tax=Streptomyces diacarni TaxID=2800381 RepID=UPI0033D37B1E
MAGLWAGHVRDGHGDGQSQPPATHSGQPGPDASQSPGSSDEDDAAPGSPQGPEGPETGAVAGPDGSRTEVPRGWKRFDAFREPDRVSYQAPAGRANRVIIFKVPEQTLAASLHAAAQRGRKTLTAYHQNAYRVGSGTAMREFTYIHQKFGEQLAVDHRFATNDKRYAVIAYGPPDAAEATRQVAHRAVTTFRSTD